MIAKLAITVIWILAAALLFRLLSVWDQLPDRVAVHFGITLRPDGWARRSTMALLIFLVLIGHAALSTWLVLAHVPGSAMVSAIQLATATMLFSVFWQLITFNIAGKPLKVIWIVLPALLIAGSIGALLSGVHHSVR
jgi:Protein of unknown function (DUF1648)